MGEFFLGILETTIGMSVLILLMLLTLKLIGGKFTAKCRYILWTLVLLRFAVPLSFGILPAQIEIPMETPKEPVSVQMQTQIPIQITSENYSPAKQMPMNVQPQEPIQMPVPPMEKPLVLEAEPDPLTWEDVNTYIPHAYLVGTAGFLLWNLLAYGIYTGKILFSAREADGETQAIYEAVCRKKGLRRMPKLLVSQNVSSPAAFGLLCRGIVLPDIALTENGLISTLSHEVTHCKRGDLWIKAFCLLARSFHWFNPLVHLAALKYEMEMELSCDEAVLAGCDENTRAAYGEVMLDIIKRCRRNSGALTTHFNPKKNAVKVRLQNILYGSGKRKGMWLIAVCLVLCLVSGTIVACRVEGGSVNPDSEDDSLISVQSQMSSDYLTGVEGIISNDWVINDGKYYFVTKKVKSSGVGAHKMLTYYDFETGVSNKICPDPLCKHKNPSICKYVDLQELYFTDTPGVFYSIYMQTRNPEIRKIDLNADTSKTVHVCSTFYTIIIGSDNNKLYFYEVEAVADKDQKEQRHLYCVDMKTEQVTDLGYFPEDFELEFSILFIYKGELYCQAIDSRLVKMDMQFTHPTEICTIDEGIIRNWFYDTNTDELFFNITNEEKNTGSVYVCRNGSAEKIELPHEDIYTFTLTESEIYYSTYDFCITQNLVNPEFYDYSGGKVYRTSRTDPSQSELVYDCADEYVICSGVTNYCVFNNNLFFDEKEVVRENIAGVEYTYFSSARTLNKIRIDLATGEMERICFD